MIEGDANIIAGNIMELHKPGNMVCVTCGNPWPCDTAIIAIGYAVAIRQRDIQAQRADHWQTARETDTGEVLTLATNLATAVEAVEVTKRLHPPSRTNVGQVGEQWTSTKGPGLFCFTCHRRWPCPTAQAVYTAGEVADAAEVAGDVPGVGPGGTVEPAGVAGAIGGEIDGDGGNYAERCRADE